MCQVWKHRTKKKQSRSSKNQSNRNLVAFLRSVRACTVNDSSPANEPLGFQASTSFANYGSLEWSRQIFPHSIQSLHQTHYSTQFRWLLHSFAVRHVCNFLLTLTLSTIHLGYNFFFFPLAVHAFHSFFTSLILFLWPIQAASNPLIECDGDESMFLAREFSGKLSHNPVESTFTAGLSNITIGETKPSRRKQLCFPSKKAIHDSLIHKKKRNEGRKNFTLNQTHSRTMSPKSARQESIDCQGGSLAHGSQAASWSDRTPSS